MRAQSLAGCPDRIRSLCAGVDTKELREKRKSSIKPPESIAAGANHWEQPVSGQRKAWQLRLDQVDFLM